MKLQKHVLTEREAIKLGAEELAGHIVAVQKIERMTWEGTVVYAKVYDFLGYIILDEDKDWIGES